MQSRKSDEQWIPDRNAPAEKLVACFLKLVARILKSEPLIFCAPKSRINFKNE
jgi:hypothetical protein